MCLIAIIPKGKNISDEYLKNAAHNNSDGFGFMFAKNNQLHIFKELKDSDLFINTYKEEREKYPDVNFVLHFRLATSGGTNIENTHPFQINEQIAFVHNGIFSGLGDKARSDTREFMEEVLRKLPDRWWENEAITMLIASFAGTSFLVFLTNEGNIIRNNANRWDKDSDCVFSNTSFKYKKNSVTVGSYFKGNYQNGYNYSVGGRYNDRDWYDDWGLTKKEKDGNKKEATILALPAVSSVSSYTGKKYILNAAGDVIGRID